MIGIRCKSKNKGDPATGWDGEIYEMETGELVDGVKAIDIRIRPSEFVIANLEIELEEINFQGVEIKEIKFFEKITGKKYKLVEV